MSITLPFLLVLIYGAVTVHQVHGQDPPGFINLDCGRRGSNGFSDPDTGLHYSTDEGYIDTGEARSISPEYRTSTLREVYATVRSFPGSQGTRNCYTLKPLYGKGNKALIRVGFKYGNYDNLNKVPKFDLYLGDDYWETVALLTASSSNYWEILHVPASDFVHVCLVNTGLGTPFISYLELRSFDSLNPVYTNSSGSFDLYRRMYFGRDIGTVRYKDDIYDRRWFHYEFTNSTALTSPATTFPDNTMSVPPVILTSAAQAQTKNDSFSLYCFPENSTDTVFVIMYFVELVANQSREMNIYLNDRPMLYGPFTPAYLDIWRLYGTFTLKANELYFEFVINATSNSELPPMITAAELYTIRQFLSPQTTDNDVAAIVEIKRTYGITRNWQGDPCSPNFKWIGINCSYIQGFDPYEIIGLNLSSSGLTGPISRSISNLTKLQSLDLSYNKLNGQVPDFLSELPLKYLYLEGNNFTGSLPPKLLEKSKDGSLLISFGINRPPNATNATSPNCVNDGCKKKKASIIVPVVTSVGGFLVFIALSTLIYVINRKTQFISSILSRRRTQKAAQIESSWTDGPIEPKLVQLKFSEVMCLIGEKKIIGRGGFGTVYYARMNGENVAVKILNQSPENEPRDFESEVKILATVYHKNLTKVLGYCNEGVNKAIIFELVENGNLMNHLSDENRNVLSWERRLKIMIGAAEGLEYLHHGCKPPIIHRDIKPENILLTNEFEAKLADLGFSRIFPVQSTRIVGTAGYMDPQYIHPSMMSEKIDVYSFGVVMLVVLTGQSPIIGTTNIIQWISPKIQNGDLQGIVDRRLRGNFDVNVAWRVVELAMECVSSNSASRPNMNYVVKELKECCHDRGYSNNTSRTTVSSLEIGTGFQPYTR